MSSSTRNSSNPPPFYYQLNQKQQKNWMRTTKKIEKNEELRRKYAPLKSPSNTTIIHLHRLTSTTTLNELIIKAEQTKLYTLDTESQVINGQAQGALVQIEMVHTMDYSTIILFETFHLPNPNSPLFIQMKQLCTIIFNNSNEIITWGPFFKEVENFQNFQLFKRGNVKENINLQNLFSDWHNGLVNTTHPAREKRVKGTWRSTNDIYDTPGGYDYATQEELTTIICNCGHSSHYDSNSTWSLQDAIASTFEKFLDKEETVNKWGCGLDVELGTWKKRTFSKTQYDPTEEKEKRSVMIKYAVADCIAVTRLYFTMNPPKTIANDIYTTPKLTNDKMELYTELSDVSEDELELELELEQIWLPHFDKSPSSLSLKNDELEQIWLPHFDKPSSSSKNNEQNDLTLQVTTEEMDEFTPAEKPTEQQQPQSNKKSSKSERQRQKNLKLKWKQQNLPHFQNKIKRPIYYKYDYRKIRSQLMDDNIFTSRQITINHKLNEVMIGFKSQQQQQQATKIIKINYFSKNQYYDRWG